MLIKNIHFFHLFIFQGHSLGARICCVAGRYFFHYTKQLLYRITILDAARNDKLLSI